MLTECKFKSRERTCENLFDTVKFRILETVLEMFKVQVGLNYQLLPEYQATTVNHKRDLLKNKSEDKGSF